jgi:predicted glutamine amidotransferase
MCQLLGLSSNKEVDIQFSIREFYRRGKQNPHGWGFAFFEKTDWRILKKPSTFSNENIQSEPFKFKSKTIIGHVRLASCGNKTHLNTHPFTKKNWVFAHNGTVTAIKSLPEFRLQINPEGETDSEHAFLYKKRGSFRRSNSPR